MSGPTLHLKESPYLSKNGVVVTDYRLTVSGKTYLIQDIGEVKVEHYHSKVPSIIFLLAAGFLVYQIGLIALLFPGSIFIVLALFAYKADIFTYQLKIVTPKGEVAVLSDNNENWVRSVAHAISRAQLKRSVLR